MKHIKWILVFICTLFLYPEFSRAQSIDETSIKTAFVLNFVEHCIWPENQKRQNLIIYGIDTEISKSFRGRFSSEKFRNREILVKETILISDLETADIIFVTSSKTNDIGKIYSLIANKPILLITDNANSRDELMINLVKKTNKIGYRIYPLTLIRQGLKFEKELLIYAENAMDYPDQFVEIEKDLDIQKKKITEQEEIIQKREEDTKVLEDRIDEMALFLMSYEKTIVEQRNQIKTSQNTLDSLNEQLANNQTLLFDYMDSISANKLWMRKQKDDINDYADKIDEQVKTISEQQALLKSLDTRINNQRKSLDNQAYIIDKQGNLLIIFTGLVFVIIVLGILFFIAFQKNKKASMILKKQNDEIALSQELLQKQTIKLKLAKDQIEDYSKKLEEINSDLEKEVSERTKHLTKTNKELDRFVYSVSHDIKAPLASILGIVNLMKYENLEYAVKEYVSKIELSVGKLNLFITEVLEFSRNARTEIHSEEVDLEKQIYSIFEELRYLQDGIEVIIQVQVNEIKPFFTDRSRFVIILKNILSNSLKYYDPVKGNCKISIFATVSHNICRMTISDNGQGIKKEYQGKIYDMFYRTHENSEGSGLGLYIVKETIEKIKGRIKIKSVAGKGTTAILLIPNQLTNHSHKTELLLN